MKYLNTRHHKNKTTEYYYYYYLLILFAYKLQSIVILHKGMVISNIYIMNITKFEGGESMLKSYSKI